MSVSKEILVPDIGDFDAVPVIEILVGVGDRVGLEDPLVTLESDKATMDIPSPSAGIVSEISVSIGDQVSQGSLLLHLTEEAQGDSGPSDSGSSAEAEKESPAATPKPAPDSPAAASASASASASTAAAAEPPSPPPKDADPGASESTAPAPVDVLVPDIGEFTDVPVIDILVSPGDRVAVEDPLITLESDKAAMDIPSTVAGKVANILIHPGDRVSQGMLILTVEPFAQEADKEAAQESAQESPSDSREPQAAEAQPPKSAPSDSHSHSQAPPSSAADSTRPLDPRAPRGSPTASLAPKPEDKRPVSHATPAMRRFARELGVDLAAVKGTGRKGRILREDINTFVKEALGAAASAASGAPQGSGIPPIPEVDFAKFGEIETRPIARIKRISGPHLHRSWLNLPHVTSHEEADITQLEAFRLKIKDEAKERGVRITLLAFVTHAVARALKEYPGFNASLGAGGDTLVLKKYVHIGIAVDTPGGLMVPVLRDADRKGVYEIAKEMSELGAKAREGALKPDEMRGGTFSISSLGGIGGTAFTPIINAPEAAILGLSRTRMSPVWDGETFQPRLMLPLDLSWDHRIVDGAEAARFLAHLSRSLSDMRRLLL
ncbi:MAG: dihydrolipoyllysine-residue acetyltransferase [Ectothiorhodospiraceae bacterium AqS1]|nr:dihydrolipoyllysine-residue acetyltransferase [Ectothiorhodospiraceae bacterium AqS1]